LTASVSGSSVLLTEVGTAGAGFAVTSSLTPAMRSTSGGVATRSSLYVDDGGTGVNQQVTIAGNYAEDDLLTITVNGVDVNYTVTATDVAGGGNTAADFARIAAGFKAAYDASTNLAHTPVAMTQDGAVLTLAANVQTVPFTLDSDVTGDSSVTIDAAISVSDGDKVEFFNPAAVIASATSAAVGSRNITVAPSAAVEPGQYVFKVVNGVVTRLVDSAGAPIRVSANNGTALQLSAVPSVDLSSATLVFYNPVSYQLTLQDGSKVSMSGDLNSKNVGQQFTAVTSQYEVYASLDEKFYNAGDNKFYSDIPFEQPVGNGVYKPVAEMQFWGGKNIDALVTNEISGKPTFESQVVLTGKVTTNGNNALSTDPDLIFNLDLTGTKNFATPFGVDQSTQDGRSVALLNSVSIDDEGKIVGTYGDGRSFIAGQLVLVNFAATDGLVPSGENVFTSSYMSGDEVDASVIVGRPGDKGLGGIRAGAVEGSNVDLANELVKLLIQQRMYSANSQSIRAFDDTLTTTIRMAGG
jgi:flagellar hook-basal body protein